MNIFVLSECPTESAEMMVDKHVVKMPTESMQMMCTIANLHDYQTPFAPVMLNHPCTIWARQSRQNFNWLREHTLALCKEYTRRYGKRLKVEWCLKEYDATWITLESELPDIGLTPFAVAISDHMNCRQLDGFDDMSVVDKYRAYYMHDKNHFASWKTQKPSWFTA